MPKKPKLSELWSRGQTCLCARLDEPAVAVIEEVRILDIDDARDSLTVKYASDGHVQQMTREWVEKRLLAKTSDKLAVCVSALERISQMNHKDIVSDGSTSRHRAVLLAEKTLAELR